MYNQRSPAEAYRKIDFDARVAGADPGQLVALAEVDRGEIVPKRVFNLAGLVGSRRPHNET